MLRSLWLKFIKERVGVGVGGDWINLADFLPVHSSEKTFVIYCLLSCTAIPFWIGVYPKGKWFAPVFNINVRLTKTSTEHEIWINVPVAGALLSCVCYVWRLMIADIRKKNRLYRVCMQVLVNVIIIVFILSKLCAEINRFSHYRLKPI